MKEDRVCAFVGSASREAHKIDSRLGEMELVIPLTPEELMQIGPDYIERCKPTFEQRCKDGPGLTGVVQSKGICRIDLLRSKKFFKGLTPYTGPGKRGPNYWQLHFERIEDLPTPTGHYHQSYRHSRR